MATVTCPRCAGRTQFFDAYEDEPAFRRCVRCPWVTNHIAASSDPPKSTTQGQ